MRGFLAQLAPEPALPVHTRIAAGLTILFPLLYLIGSAAADVAAVLVSLAFLWESYRLKDWAWLRRSWVVLVFALWGYFTLRGGFAQDSGAAIGRALAWIRYPLFAMALAFYILRIPAVSLGLLAVLTVTLAFIMADSALQYVWGRDLFGRLPLMSAEGSLRLTGPFGDPKVGVVLAWLGFPVLAGLAKRNTLLAGVFALALLVTVFLSGERMALLLVLFGFGLLALCVRMLRVPALMAAGAGLALMVVLAQSNPALLERQYASTVTTIQQYQQSPYGQIWQSALAMIEAQPVFGVGPKHFRLLCPSPEYGPQDTPYPRCNIHPHQLYLEWLVEGGIIALGLFLGLLYCIGRDALRCWKPCREDALYPGLLVAVVLRIWPLSTATSFFAAWSALPFWLIVGWLLALAHDKIGVRG